MNATASRTKIRFRKVGNKDGLVDRVVHAIEAQILDGHLPVGTKLPAEREFSEQLGVSRPVVREAVRILTARGQLETQHGIGTTVRSLACTDIVKPLTLFLRTRGTVINLYHLHQVRSILEIESAGLAAGSRNDEDTRKLSAICAAMETSAEDPAQFSLHDHEFHRSLSEATHNPLLSLLLNTVHEMMAEIRMLIANTPALFERVMPTHRLIVQAVISRDPERARAAMHEHLEIALAIQVALIAEQEDAKGR